MVWLTLCREVMIEVTPSPTLLSVELDPNAIADVVGHSATTRTQAENDERLADINLQLEELIRKTREAQGQINDPKQQKHKPAALDGINE